MHPIERHAGTLAPIVAFGGILLAIGLDPTFSWTEDALSHLGVREASHIVFNAALILGGGLAVVYAAGLWRTSAGRTGRIVAVGFGLAAIHLVGVGLFPAGHPLHAPAAIGFYALVTVVYLVDGSARRRTWTGRGTASLAVVHVLIWASWFAGLWPGSGLALPEFCGAVLVAGWIWVLGPRPTLRPDQSIAM